MNNSMIRHLAVELCRIDPLAPDPGANILWNGKNCDAWEARVPIIDKLIDEIYNAGFLIIEEDMHDEVINILRTTFEEVETILNG